MRKVLSARGEVVNFDLLQIKQQIANAPKPIVVQARESFVDQRTKRRAHRPAAPSIPAVPSTPEPQNTESIGEENNAPEAEAAEK